MKQIFYPKLAWMSIRRNSQLYTPYLLTCVGMVAMSYIVSFLGNGPMLDVMRGGDIMKEFLNIGFVILSVFALIFLFYTNSFLMRRRKRELGLYNILGMGKKNLTMVLLWETLVMGAISLVGGLFCGIALSKFSELVLINLLKEEVSYHLRLSGAAIHQTLVLFVVIFGLIFVNTLCQLHVSSPIQLLRSENVGEKPPKTNWFIALMGAVLLGGAYWLAVSIQDPLSAIIWFMVGVIMVIIATYLLFMAGSVAICRILQKNKRYYYKTNHFVSVSSMIYRMRRNGAGLASICILCTMVLVTLSSTSCLYLGAEDSLRQNYPRNIYIDLSEANTKSNVAQLEQLNQQAQEIRQIAQETVAQHDTEMQNEVFYRALSCGGKVEDGVLALRNNLYSSVDYQELYNVIIVSLDDYNRLMGTRKTLESGQAMIYLTKNSSYPYESIRIEDGEMLQIVEREENFAAYQMSNKSQMLPTMYLFVEDIDRIAQQMRVIGNGDEDVLTWVRCYYGFDLNVSDEQQIEIYQQLEQQLQGEVLT